MKLNYSFKKNLLIFVILAVIGNIYSQEWQAFGPIGGQKYISMHVDTVNDYLYLGTTEGFWFQNMETQEWTSAIEVDWIGRAVWSICANPVEPGTVITGRDNAWFKGYMEISYDHGETNEFLYESTGGWVTDIKFSPNNPSIYYATTFSDGPANGEFLKSTDGGSSWSPLASPHFALTSIAVYPNDYNTVIISGDGLVTKSTNGGVDWNSISGDLPVELGVYEVALNKADLQSLVCSNDDGIWQSDNGGMNWINTYPESCSRLVYNPIETNMVAALTQNTNQILISLDNGKNWMDYTSDFPIDEYSKDIDFSKDGTQLFCTSYYDVYVRELTLVGIQDVTDSNEPSFIKNISPNPFRQNLDIELFLNQDQNISIKIYNISGQEIIELYLGQLQQGLNHIRWNAKNEQKGVYFCKITLENAETLVKKIVKQE